MDWATKYEIPQLNSSTVTEAVEHVWATAMDIARRHARAACYPPKRAAKFPSLDRISLIVHRNDGMNCAGTPRLVKCDFSIKPIAGGTATSVRYCIRNHCSLVYNSHREGRHATDIFSYINAHLAISIRGTICKGQIEHKTCNVVILSGRLCRYFMRRPTRRGAGVTIMAHSPRRAGPRRADYGAGGGR